MKTCELKGDALNWAVQKAERLIGVRAPVDYSGRWEFGGPIIEREMINLKMLNIALWEAETDTREEGPTPLIAAMRCYVASELGDEVEIPEELCQY